VGFETQVAVVNRVWLGCWDRVGVLVHARVGCQAGVTALRYSAGRAEFLLCLELTTRDSAKPPGSWRSTDMGDATQPSLGRPGEGAYLSLRETPMLPAESLLDSRLEC